MRLGGTASFAVEVTNLPEIRKAVAWAEAHALPIMMIGDGSNIVWRDEGFKGLLIINQLKRFEERQDGDDYYVTIGAGENWDSVVARVSAKGMTGVEALSLIPGTAGAAPVQNVGAYYQDISRVLVEVEAYDTQTKQVVIIPKEDCQFVYRSSRFKTTDRGRFLITAITLHLLHKNPEPPFYASLQAYLSEHDITTYTPKTIRAAIIAIRKSKLPDPSVVANNGSFFTNPFITGKQLAELLDKYEGLIYWATDDGRIKIPAAWLIEKAGFKNYHDPETGMATWPAQPLVLVNEHATSAAQVMAFKQKVVDAVEEKFGIVLEQEPELLP